MRSSIMKLNISAHQNAQQTPNFPSIHIEYTQYSDKVNYSSEFVFFIGPTGMNEMP